MAPDWKDENVGLVLAEKATAYIRSHAAEQPDKPFFLYYAATAPHTPCVPADFVKGKSLAGKRGDMVVEFDWTTGKIIDLLNELNLCENTILIVTSDNGALTDGPPHWGEPLDREKYDVDHRGHRPNGVLRGQKADIWEGGSRVPLIIRWPGLINRDCVNRNLISLIDFYSTFADILNEPLPEEVIDSYNMLPTLRGERIDDRSSLIFKASRTDLFGIRKDSWKLIDGRGSGGFTQPIGWVVQEGEPQGQLYNLDTDMSETNNLWSSHPGLVQKLKRLLEEYKNKELITYEKKKSY